jgi:hypothetical protein
MVSKIMNNPVLYDATIHEFIYCIEILVVIVIVIVILFTFHKSNVGYNPVDIDIVPYYTNTCHYTQC